MGTETQVYLPAFDKHVAVRITRMKDVGTFAVWKATKALEGFDLKTFEVKARPVTKMEGLRPGMSLILKR